MNTKDNLKEIFISMGCEFMEGTMMSRYTTVRIGGKADLIVFPDSSEMLLSIIGELSDRAVPFLVLGGGSNVLISDSGIRGVVIKLDGLNRIDIIETDQKEVLLFVQAGKRLQGLLSYLMKEGLTGLEGLTGIPGTVGGAIVGNAGAYGYEMMDVVEAVKVIRNGNVEIISKDRIPWGYRNGGLDEAQIVLGALVRLNRDSSERVRSRMEQFIKEKKSSQPISEASAGCVFKNPAGQSAGKLIDQAGCKGMKRGGIEVSSVHANFFINRGGGKAADFIALMEEVREMVFKRFSVELEPEIKLIGCMLQ